MTLLIMFVCVVNVVHVGSAAYNNDAARRVKSRGILSRKALRNVKRKALRKVYRINDKRIDV